MSNKSNGTVATMGIDIGKNSFHVVGLNQRGAIVLRQKWSCGQIEARLANMPSCLIGIARGQHPSPEGGAHNAGGGRQNAGEGERQDSFDDASCADRRPQ